jgi:glycosyltransferase involved in cell wall biosynthesis
MVFRLANDSDIDPEYLQSNYSASLQQLYRSAVRGAAAVMTQTEQQQEALKQEFGVDSRVVTNAYDLPSENEIVPHSEREGILWVGSADPHQKKPQRFLHLANALPNIRFNMIAKPIIGDGGCYDRLQSEAQDISNLKFIGEVSPGSIHKYYNQNKVLVNTSDYEGFPNTFLEAWRYETPVLSHSFDIDGLLSSSEVGFLTGDLDTLIQKTRLLNQDTELRSQIGSAARQLIKQKFSLDAVTTEYETVFRISVSE